MAAQTGQHHGAATMPAVTASPSILQGDESMFAASSWTTYPKHAACQALNELMRKLLLVHRLEAEECLAKREPPAKPT
jgi:hypothetical protein